MKTFKIIDFLLQIIFIVIGVVFLFSIDRSEVNGTAFFMSYILIGIWQVGSAIIHLPYKAPYKTTMRQIYLILLANLIILTFISGGERVLFLGEVLLYGSPLMAIYYCITCFMETKWLIDQDNAVAEQVSQ